MYFDTYVYTYKYTHTYIHTIFTRSKEPTYMHTNIDIHTRIAGGKKVSAATCIHTHTSIHTYMHGMHACRLGGKRFQR